MTHGVGLVVGNGPGLPKVLMFLYRAGLLIDPYSIHQPHPFHLLRKVRRLVANPDRASSDG